MVIATSETSREIAQSRGHKRPDDVFVVRSGPDMSRFTPVPANPALKNGGRYLVGYVGVMGAQEGVDHVIRAAKSIREEMGRDDVSFVLIGDGPAGETCARWRESSAPRRTCASPAGSPTPR